MLEAILTIISQSYARPDPKTIHERSTVLAVIQDVDRETGFCAEGSADRIDGMRARIRALQKSAVSPQRFLWTLPGLPFELFADENHRVVGKGWIREHDTHFGFVLFKKRSQLGLIEIRFDGWHGVSNDSLVLFEADLMQIASPILDSKFWPPCETQCGMSCAGL